MRNATILLILTISAACSSLKKKSSDPSQHADISSTILEQKDSVRKDEGLLKDKNSKSKSAQTKKTSSKSEKNDSSIKYTTSKNPIEEEKVLAWISEDQEKVSIADKPFIQYSSLHTIYNTSLAEGPDDFEFKIRIARLGLSKTLNAHARHAPKIYHPKAIDPHGVVFKFDIRDYWGYQFQNQQTWSIEKNSDRALAVWGRIKNTSNAESSTNYDNRKQGVHEEYIEVEQLAYTMTRPGFYDFVMDIPPFASTLENQIGIDTSFRSRNPENYKKYIFRIIDDAITIGPRILFRADLTPEKSQELQKRGGTPELYYWRSAEPFYGRQVTPENYAYYQDPMPFFSGGLRVKDQNNANAAEIIFGLANGLQGFMIAGNADQRRTYSEFSVVFDPTRERRGRRFRLVNGISCHRCHVTGMNMGPNDIRGDSSGKNHITLDSPEASQQWSEEQLNFFKSIYPDSEKLKAIYEKDKKRYTDTLAVIFEGIVGKTEDKDLKNRVLRTEPMSFLSDLISERYGYSLKEIDLDAY